MMKATYLILGLCLPICAMAAETAPAQKIPAETRALDNMLRECVGREFVASRAAAEEQDRIATLTGQLTDSAKQIDDLMKERNALKAKGTPEIPADK